MHEAVSPLRFGREDGATVSRAAFLAEARTWMETPFMHQRSIKLVGCDCGGLVRGVCVSMGLLPPDYMDRIEPDLRGYPSRPDGIVMRAICDRFLRRTAVADVRPADMLLFRFGVHPQHTAIVGDYVHGGLSMIHALGPSHPAKVVEHSIDATWRKRIVAAYAIPGID